MGQFDGGILEPARGPARLITAPISQLVREIRHRKAGVGGYRSTRSEKLQDFAQTNDERFDFLGGVVDVEARPCRTCQA